MPPRRRNNPIVVGIWFFWVVAVVAQVRTLVGVILLAIVSVSTALRPPKRLACGRDRRLSCESARLVGYSAFRSIAFIDVSKNRCVEHRAASVRAFSFHSRLHGKASEILPRRTEEIERPVTEEEKGGVDGDRDCEQLGGQARREVRSGVGSRKDDRLSSRPFQRILDPRPQRPLSCNLSRQ